MATIYVCDGCDKKFNTMNGNLTNVDITFEHFAGRLSTDEKIEEHLDLCNRCVSSFKRHIENVRTVRAAAA